MKIRIHTANKSFGKPFYILTAAATSEALFNMTQGRSASLGLLENVSGTEDSVLSLATWLHLLTLFLPFPSWTFLQVISAFSPLQS